MHDFEKVLKPYKHGTTFCLSSLYVCMVNTILSSLALSKHHYCKALLESFAIINLCGVSTKLN